jgi:hypothetical protein
VEGSAVGGLVAQQKAEGLDGVAVLEVWVLERQSALAGPVVLRHLLDQDQFGAGGWPVLFDQVTDELAVIGFIFVGEEEESSGERVFTVVACGGGFPGFSLRAAAVLGVSLIG